METEAHIEFEQRKAHCELQMRLDVCNGCDACGLRCAVGVPVAPSEWEALKEHLAHTTDAERTDLLRVQAQEKTVDLGDGVTTRMCRYRDMENGRCAIYRVRPLACRLMGQVEWMPCPIEKVPQALPTSDALALMRAYARLPRHTFEEWEEVEKSCTNSITDDRIIENREVAPDNQ